jgi:glycosyltransferase involved in cell wall biosynthesis
MTSGPSVTLGLPVFNGEAFLVQALETILGQTYGDFELIISDNASTDATPDIVHDYASRDTRIRCFRQASNVGAGNNWSFVAEQARGQWVKWVSANDEYSPRLLEDCLEPLRRDPSVVLCYGRTQFIDLAGCKGDVYAGDFEALSDSPLERYRVVRKGLHLSTPIQSGVIRSDALRRCGFMGNYRDSDRILIFGLALTGKFVLLPQVLFYRRWAPQVTTTLREPVEIERTFHPQAKYPPRFPNLPRQLGHLGIALRAPAGLRAKTCTLVTAVRCTNWIRKLLGEKPTHSAGEVAGN